MVLALKQLKQAQESFEFSRLHSKSTADRLENARMVVDSYEKLGDAIERDIEIKQSVISLLHMLCFVLIMGCIVAIALEARRVLVDRLDRLISFIPDKYIEATYQPQADEVFYLEQKVIGMTARLEGYAAEAAWVNQTNERLRWMINAQDYLFKFVEIINSNLLNDLTLRKLLYSLDRVLDASNAAVIFYDDAPSASAGRVVFTQHMPMPFNAAILTHRPESVPRHTLRRNRKHHSVMQRFCR
jgi:two-component system nitrate/nitrite sensor histidine kinase NarX